VGSGFAIVPTPVLLGEVPKKETTGICLLIIVFDSMAGFLGYWDRVGLGLYLIVSFTFIAAITILVSTHFSRRIEAKGLEREFDYFLIAWVTTCH
jgi:hypothetical protein